MCDNRECGVHSRNDVEIVERPTQFVSKISYHGEWAVFTADNSFDIYLAMLGGQDRPHMTLLVKVGDGALGDLNDGLKDAVYEGYFSENIDGALEAHEMVKYGLESGILNLTTPVQPVDVVMRYLNV